NRQRESPDLMHLQTSIESYRSREATTPSNRLREPLQNKIGELTELTNDPSFDELPQEKREYILDRLKELQDYRAYAKALQELPSLANLHSDRELDDLEVSLKQL